MTHGKRPDNAEQRGGSGVKPAPDRAVPAAQPAGAEDALVREFEQVLIALEAQIQKLSALAGARREAMRRADAAGLAACIAEENQAVQQVADLEKRRVAVVGHLAQRLGLPDKTQARATDVAERVGGPAGERLRTRAESVRAGVIALTRTNTALKLAAQHLAAHMDGLWRQASAVLNHAQTYGRRGIIGAGPSVVSALDVRS